MDSVEALALTAVLFLALDGLWLGVVARDFYRRGLGPLLAEPVRLLPAIAFYAIYLAGLYVFVLKPALAAGGAFEAARLGAFFGFCAYATYNLTNLATLKAFPARLALADLAWGTAASGLAAGAGLWLAHAV